MFLHLSLFSNNEFPGRFPGRSPYGDSYRAGFYHTTTDRSGIIRICFVCVSRMSEKDRTIAETLRGFKIERCPDESPHRDIEMEILGCRCENTLPLQIDTSLVSLMGKRGVVVSIGGYVIGYIRLERSL